jgi:hypothetical protein
MLNALLQIEAYNTNPAEGAIGFPFVPTYAVNMPEYYGELLEVTHPIQDLCPFTTYDLYTSPEYPNGHPHGENSRVINGQIVPCGIFVTEIGVEPRDFGVSKDSTTAMLIKAKADSRMLVFYLNKGANQVDLFEAVSVGPGDPKSDSAYDCYFQLLSQKFIDYVAQNNAYPVPDTEYASPVLLVIKRIVNRMNHELDPSLNGSNTRALTVNGVSDTHNNYQFLGDGTAAHPSGYDRERFAFLPFQSNAHHFVIPYYVMTVNITQPLTPEAFTIDVSGINAVGATFTAYDPLNNVSVPVKVNSRATNEVNLTLTAADYPYLLIVQEAAN